MVTVMLTVMILIVLVAEAVLKRLSRMYVKPLEHTLRAFYILGSTNLSGTNLDRIKTSGERQKPSGIVSIVDCAVFSANEL